MPLAYLVVGLGAGYWFGSSRDPTSPGNVSSSAGRASKDNLGANRPDTSTPATRHASLDELADDYSTKRARLFAESLSPNDLAASLTYLNGKTKNTSIRSLSLEIVKAWAAKDPAAAWKQVSAMNPSAEKSAFLGAIAAVQASRQADAAVKQVMALASPGERRATLKAMFEAWGRNDAPSALKYWLSHPELPVDRYVGDSIISGLAATNPAMAAQLAMQIPVGDYDTPLNSALNRWLDLDAAAAKSWISGITDPVQRDRVLKSFCNAQSNGNPAEALKLSAQISASDARREAQRSIVSNWLRNDPDAASAYIASPEGLAMAAGWEIWLSSAMSSLTAEEQNHVLNRLPEGAMKEGIVAGLVRNATARGNYSHAVQILNAMPDSSDRDRSLHDLAVKWGKADPKAVAAWIGKQADSSDRDLIVAGYSGALAAVDPHGAIETASAIPDESVQKSALRNILTIWMGSNPAAAKAWLDSSKMFSAMDKQMIERMSKMSSGLLFTPRIKNRR